MSREEYYVCVLLGFAIGCIDVVERRSESVLESEEGFRKRSINVPISSRRRNKSDSTSIVQDTQQFVQQTMKMIQW